MVCGYSNESLFKEKILKYQNSDEESWPRWISDIYQHLIVELLKHKSFYDKGDIYDYIKLLNDMHPFTDEALVDHIINVIEEIKTQYQEIVPYLCLSLIPYLMSAKERWMLPYIPNNKYRENNLYITEAKRFIQLGKEIVNQYNDPFKNYAYMEEVVYQLYISDEFYTSLDEFDDLYKENVSEYLKLYEEVLKDHPEIKDEYVHGLEDEREFYNWDLEEVLEREPREMRHKDLFKSEKSSDDQEEIDEEEYDDSAYQDLNNDDVEDIKVDFLHHVYDYCFDLLISDQVTTRYKKEQVDIDSKSGPYLRKKEKLPECDKEFLRASFFLTQLSPTYGSDQCLSVLYNSWYGQKYYLSFKHLFFMFDLFEESTYEAPRSYIGGSFAYYTHIWFCETFDHLGYPEISTEVCRLLSLSYYNKESYDNGGAEDFLFNISSFYYYYLDYAENSNDQKAYYYALKNMKHITHAQFDYTPAYEPDNKVDTEKMWQEIKTLFNKIENTTIETKDSMKAEIESNPYIIDKYKKLLLKCLCEPFTMADQYGFLDYPEPICMLNPSDEALMDAFNKLKTDLNMVETIYAYSEICYQYILKGEDELYLEYSEKFGDVLTHLEDYHDKIDYLALSAISRYLFVCLSCSQDDDRFAVIISGCHMITKVFYDYIGDKWKNFDYITMKLCYDPILKVIYIEELYAGLCEEEHTVTYLDSLCHELESLYQYLDKTWIGENHIVNDQKDANRNDGRLDGVFTKERQTEYLLKTQELIDAWKDEDHTKEEYQEKYKQFLDECFPLPEFYSEDKDFFGVILEKLIERLKGESNG